MVAIPLSRAAPPDLVNVREIDPRIHVDLAYRGSRNFLGRKVQGYSPFSNNCYLRERAARALLRANDRLRASNPPMALFLRDCWRPVRASLDMTDWATKVSQSRLNFDDMSPEQGRFFEDPRLFDVRGTLRLLRAERMFRLGYLSYGLSQHNRGSTLDTEVLIYLNGTWRIAETGTGFDVFSRKSAFASSSISPEARRNRNALAQAMRSEGFRVLSTEWWHWTHSSNSGPALDGSVD